LSLHSTLRPFGVVESRLGGLQMTGCGPGIRVCAWDETEPQRAWLRPRLMKKAPESP